MAVIDLFTVSLMAELFASTARVEAMRAANAASPDKPPYDEHFFRSESGICKMVARLASEHGDKLRTALEHASGTQNDVSGTPGDSSRNNTS